MNNVTAALHLQEFSDGQEPKQEVFGTWTGLIPSTNVYAPAIFCPLHRRVHDVIGRTCGRVHCTTWLHFLNREVYFQCVDPSVMIIIMPIIMKLTLHTNGRDNLALHIFLVVCSCQGNDQ